ncbi:nuclear RNA export factor 1 [Elysia marginata]|uniref:Nuclear RNA export factor 1 n=1 Tax=Elysia marginata TaxID=1093978 RepID=A0AAV4H4K8_9GAST|nr:nuclear RNA export factor 1 [Elysia marginata]
MSRPTLLVFISCNFVHIPYFATNAPINFFLFTIASAVRKTFPKVLRLDGTELPPPITFDLDTELKLPESQGSYFMNDDIKNLVVAFIKDYFTVYDSDRRRDLMQAYHENAQFSISCSRNPMFEKQVGFHSYVDGSRNLKRVGHLDPGKLSKKIHTGNLHVIAFLEKMPLTTHDVHSFKVDVTLALPTLLSFVVHGVFKETDARSDKLIRAFSRSFITVPSGSGMVIINDMFTLTNAGYELTKNAFKTGAPTPSPSPVSAAAGSGSPATSSASPYLTPAQIQMVEKFTSDSGMNKEFSFKCLQENEWNYEKAGQTFTALHSQGKIPPQAFVKDAA